MHIVAVAWIFVVVLMTVAEATSTQGSVLGALVTLVLYGLLPLAIVMYLMGTPMRRRARRAAELQEEAAAEAAAAAARVRDSVASAGDGGSQPAGSRLSPVRKEP